MNKGLIGLLLFLVFLGCNNSKKSSYVMIDDKNSTKEQEHRGKKLMEINCYVCHSPSASENDRIGPPMIAIKKRYISNTTTKEEFVNAIQAFIKNPTTENAKMFGAVRRFGVMPKTPFPDKTIQQITSYMFEFDIEQPEWFENHFNKKRGRGLKNNKGNQKQQAQNNFENLPYKERGLKYALTTKAVLGKNLMGTIQKKGTLEALTFCNEKAYPLTDSMSVVYNAAIKRVSDKPRNYNNQANADELTYIKTFKKEIANGQEPKPIVNDLNTKVQIYYPIITNTMCLQCHGKPNEHIQPRILKSLAELYPNDKAIGYDINQVRGLWSVTFDK
jgi:cytochrome c553